MLLTATVTPEDATDATVIWTSSDETIATVDADGVVKALAPGKVTITASAGDQTAECVVTVDKTTGIELPGIDNEAPLKVYDLNGRYISDKLEGLVPGYYIIRQGDKSGKYCIR